MEYLGGVEHAVVTELSDEPRYAESRGGAPENPPADQLFWAALATGAGEQTLEWEPEDGSWEIVVMNADGSRGVATDLSIGAELDPLIWIGIGLLVGGGLLAAVAAIADHCRRTSRRPLTPDFARPLVLGAAAGRLSAGG